MCSTICHNFTGAFFTGDGRLKVPVLTFVSRVSTNGASVRQPLRNTTLTLGIVFIIPIFIGHPYRENRGQCYAEAGRCEIGSKCSLASVFSVPDLSDWIRTSLFSADLPICRRARTRAATTSRRVQLKRSEHS